MAVVPEEEPIMAMGAWAAGSQSRKLSGHVSSPTQKTELVNRRWGKAINPHSMLSQVVVSSSALEAQDFPLSWVTTARLKTL